MRRSAIWAVCLTLLMPLQIGAQSASAKPPQTKRTQALSKETYAVLEAAQKLYDEKQLPAARAKLEELKPRFEKLNDYEKAVYWNFMASIAYAQNDSKGALEAYKNVLRQNELPELLRSNTLYSMAQISFATEQYRQSIKIMGKWLTLATDIKPEPHLLLAQAHYQLKEYKAAEVSTIEALKVARQKSLPPKENWLSLLRAVYYEQKEYLNAARVLESLAQRWPKLSYWLQLAGLYGLSNEQDKQLAVLRANYEAGALTKEGDQLNLARLYLIHNAPFAAVQVLHRGFGNKSLAENQTSLQLYAQALNQAKERESEIATLAKLAALTGESKHYVYLGQAELALGHWREAAAAYKKAAQAKNVDRPGNLQMMIGNALYNDKQYAEAKAAFQSALQYQDTVKDAATWVNFMDKEIQRTKALERAS